jgi:hypothetical protein
MYRLRVNLGAFPGAPGLNTWWFKGSGAVTSDADQAGTAVRTFYEAVKGNVIAGMSIDIPSEFDTFDEATGVLSGSIVASGGFASVTGAGVQTTLSRATQMKLRFLTGAVSDGRRVAGGIFLGPLHSAALTGTGAINGTNGTAVVTALNALRVAMTGNLKHAVYRQPREATLELEARAGAGFPCTAYGYKALPGVLRSRRD